MGVGTTSGIGSGTPGGVMTVIGVDSDDVEGSSADVVGSCGGTVWDSSLSASTITSCTWIASAGTSAEVRPVVWIGGSTVQNRNTQLSHTNKLKMPHTQTSDFDRTPIKHTKMV